MRNSFPYIALFAFAVLPHAVCSQPDSGVRCTEGNCRNGQGVLTSVSRGVKVCEQRGTWQAGLMEGRGQMHCWSGKYKLHEFDGIFKNDVKQGYGVQIVYQPKDGSILEKYAGCWVNDEKAPAAQCEKPAGFAP